MNIKKRDEHSLALFLKRTLAGQIHFVGFVAAIVGLVYLIIFSQRQDTASVVACSIFGGTAILVFGISATYHFLHDGYSISPRLEALFEALDHFSIYCFIAGTYTAVLINAVSYDWQFTMLTLVWSIALIGIFYTQFRERLPKIWQSRGVYTGLFVLMGWTLLLRVGEIMHNLNAHQIWMVMSGAAAYTIGAVVYALKKPALFPGFFSYHEVWHLLVLVGFAFHYALVIDFYL
jgi:hemolysin III